MSSTRDRQGLLIGKEPIDTMWEAQGKRVRAIGDTVVDQRRHRGAPVELRRMTARGSGGRRAAMLGVTMMLACACPLLWASTALAAPPPNDDFANAQVLTGFPVSASGTTVQATREENEPDHEGLGGEHSVWFTWEAPSQTAVTIATCGSDFPDALGVYTGNSLSSLAPVESYETTNSALCIGHPQISFNTAEGTTYWIAVDGNGPSSRGSFDLEIVHTPPPPHDDFDDPYLLSGARQIIAEGTNAGATKQPGEPDHGSEPGGSSIWFRWTASETGVAEITACRSSFETTLTVYEGDSLASLQPLSRGFPAFPWLCGSGTMQRFGVSAGDSYRFALDGSTHGGTEPAQVGEFFIDLFAGSGYRVNDGFSNAMPLSPVGHGEIEQDNEYTTREAGEPHHASQPGGASLWYTWTPLLGGRAHFDTCDADFDTLLAVYTGASLSTLQPVASNNDSTGPICPGSPGSEVTFDVVAGATYRIAVDGHGAAEGFIKLRRSESLPPDTTPPDARIRWVRQHRRNRSVSINFYATGGAWRFRCKLDRKKPASCTSPKTYKHLKLGYHRFKVWAIDAGGNKDPRPAVAHFKVLRTRKHHRRHKRHQVLQSRPRGSVIPASWASHVTLAERVLDLVWSEDLLAEARRSLIGEPPPCSSEIERPTEGRPSKIPGERREKPTAVGRAPASLAA